MQKYRLGKSGLDSWPLSNSDKSVLHILVHRPVLLITKDWTLKISIPTIKCAE